jgi:uncharacterized membrane protein YkvA (DUF1232 family)
MDRSIHSYLASAMGVGTQNRGLKGLLGMLNVHHIVRLFLSLQADRRVPWHLKAFAFCGLVYVFSPLDIMPDMFTGLGLLDDFIVMLIIMQSFMDFVPRAVMLEHCQRLGIGTDQVFISVPQTIREARGLYSFVREFGTGFREAAGIASDAVQGPRQRAAGKGAARQPVADEPAAAAQPGARYSAYKNDDGGERQ